MDIGTRVRLSPQPGRARYYEEGFVGCDGTITKIYNPGSRNDRWEAEVIFDKTILGFNDQWVRFEDVIILNNINRELDIGKINDLF